MLGVVVLSWQRTIYKLALRLPIALPLDGINSLTPFEDNIIDKVQYILAQVHGGKTGMEANILAIP